ncbi:leucine-rich repeat protein 1 [Trichogramma pretiosum]|uniref:leucine-rich repeat protein 1 n=1 Tax=Trichogramma pretiosum TaxID=7493 RepID=UPI0006C9741A|nr:leucine-rich repeat protein 1 [Trichogramma pretiosum]
MKLQCNVIITNRLMTTAPITGQRRAQKSCLAFCRTSKTEDNVYMLIQSQTNKMGTKYKINNNIEKVFVNFLKEGKATIRIVEPPLDINIKGDPLQVHLFMDVLKLYLTKKITSEKFTLIPSNKKNLLVQTKTKITIKKSCEYPVLKGFPRTTEELNLIGLQRKSFDRQILKLQSLRILDLSENQLSSLPKELGDLPNLRELNLSKNQLGKFPITKWSWLKGTKIMTNLCLLNLSGNQLTVIPDSIGKLGSLVTLHLDNNCIRALPQAVGKLHRLRILNLSKNQLSILPGNMKNLSLSKLDISYNCFTCHNRGLLHNSLGVQSLVDLAGQVIIKYGISYDASLIPYTLVPYLDKAYYCLCGQACFSSYLRKFVSLNLSDVATNITFSNDTGNNVYFDAYICSEKCFKKYNRFIV